MSLYSTLLHFSVNKTRNVIIILGISCDVRWGAWHSLVNNATFCAINFSEQLFLLSTALFKTYSKLQSLNIYIHDTQ